MQRTLGFAIATFFLLCAVLPANAVSEHLREAECSAPTQSEQILKSTDFKWYYTQSEMTAKFNDIYYSGKRLQHRARLTADGEGFELLHDSSLGLRPVPITQRFINTITRHIEKGLALHYFDYVFFPDMGHSHLWIPQSLFDEFKTPITIDQVTNFYTQALEHPETRFLYHTAEQLRMMDDQHELLPDKQLSWRYFTRNLVAHNDGSAVLDVYRNLEQIGNTVCKPAENYSVWSAGFYLNSSVNGCFAYEHEKKTYYYDISLSYPPTPVSQLSPLVSSEKQDNTSSSLWLWGLHGCEP